MFQKLLVPVDLSDKNLAALTLVLRMAEREAAEVTLLHVIETIDDVAHDEMAEFYERLEGRARQVLRELAAAGASPAVVIRQEITYGKRAREIVGFASREGIDLIVLSSHRVDPEDPGENWASLSYQVAILAQCPVLLVK